MFGKKKHKVSTAETQPKVKTGPKKQKKAKKVTTEKFVFEGTAVPRVGPQTAGTKKVVKKRNAGYFSKNYYSHAYDDLFPKDIEFRTFFILGGAAAGISYLLFMNLWISLIFLLLYGFYGVKKVVPYQMKHAYELKGMQQRNTFINSLTQIFTNQQRSILDAYNILIPRLEGEFRKDIEVLVVSITNSTEESIRQSYVNLKEKYRDDVVFGQYIDQLSVATFEGRTNLDTFKSIKTYHNTMKKKQEEFFMKKRKQLDDLKMMLGVILIFIAALMFSNGIDKYKESFAHFLPGWIAGGLFLFLVTFFLLQFNKCYQDDKIMEVR